MVTDAKVAAGGKVPFSLRAVSRRIAACSAAVDIWQLSAELSPSAFVGTTSS